MVKNIKGISIFGAILLMCLPSCGTVNNSSSIKVPSIPDSYSFDDSSSEVSSESSQSSSSQSSQSSSSSEDKDYLEVIDYAKKYYVGETLSKINRLNLKLHYKGEDRDISLKPSYYDFHVKDDQGNDVDASKPFSKPGSYSYEVYIKNIPEIVSNRIDFEVLPNSSNVLSSKSVLPEGFTYYDFENSCLDNLSFPGYGNVNVLVIPVEISDYQFKDVGYGENYIEAINNLFNGNGSTDTGYWESISSYYKKASLNKLNLKFDIAEVYKPGYSSDNYIASGIGGAFSIAAYAVENYKNVHGDSSVQKYDNDKDGYIDGVWLVYSAPHYGTGAYGGAMGQDVFWAFCSDISAYTPNLASPNIHSFGWASLVFANEYVDAPKVDAHTFIHETGHLLSLPDYYSYDFTGGSASGAQGGLAMMDLNIGDQDSFSKISLGWANPYVPTEDCVVELKPNESSGDCIILTDNWNGTAFDEYLLLDYVTPTGLNALDSSERYPGRPMYYSEPGIRMYHIDARLGEFKYIAASEDMTKTETGVYPIRDKDAGDYYVKDERVKEIVAKGSLGRIDKSTSVPLSERNSGFTVINANSASRVLISGQPYENNRLITLVSADGSHPEVDDKAGSNSSLFRVGDSWTINGKTIRFFNGDTGEFNNNDKFSFVFSVIECGEQSAKIQIKKINNQ